MNALTRLILATLVLPAAAVPAERTTAETVAIARGVEQLRHAHGEWDVVTRFLNPDGSVARSVAGTYEFHWVVPDRVLAGESHLPELKQRSAILFFVQESKGLITMASVGAEGSLWIMSGPAGGEARSTPDVPMSDGSTMRLRFTRSNVAADRFESRMEYSSDGGASWKPGNHQTFRRRA